jgi:predicted N-acetyltransferase YhbS
MTAAARLALRTEEPRDHAAVEALVEAAFRLVEHADGNAHRLVAGRARE